MPAGVPGELYIAGIQVGTVERVKLAGDHVVVGFNVRKNVHLGSDTAAASYQSTYQGALASQLEEQQLAVTGVNLDEETARLNDYQTLYSAAAQVVQAAKAMFDTLLEMVN